MVGGKEKLGTVASRNHNNLRQTVSSISVVHGVNHVSLIENCFRSLMFRSDLDTDRSETNFSKKSVRIHHLHLDLAIVKVGICRTHGEIISLPYCRLSCVTFHSII